jgi:hypothetical protein
VLQEARFTGYLRNHCLSWYTFASDNDILLEFGDLMLVTECSKTAAWTSAVYSQNSREFGLSFSVGGGFLPITNELGVAYGYEKIGSVEHRRSHRRLIAPSDVEAAPKDQTVFIKGYRLGPRSLYQRSFAQKIMALLNRSPSNRQNQNHFQQSSSNAETSRDTGAPASSSALPSSNLESLRLMDEGDDVIPLSFECPVSIRN